IVMLRKLFGEAKASHASRFYQFNDVVLQPNPVQKPVPIWIASNPTSLTWKQGASAPDSTAERSFRRVATYSARWRTSKLSPSEFAAQFGRIRAMAKDEGRDPTVLGSALYHNINVNEDRQAGLAESKKFLDAYYSTNFTAKFVEQWTISGDPKACA